AAGPRRAGRERAAGARVRTGRLAGGPPGLGHAEGPRAERDVRAGGAAREGRRGRAVAGDSHLPCPGQCNPAVVVHHSLEDGERGYGRRVVVVGDDASLGLREGDRKSTRLNSSHLVISYAVFCLKKKKKIIDMKCEQHRTERI